MDNRVRLPALVRSPYAPILVAYLLLRVITFAGLGVRRFPDSLSWLTLDFSGAGIRLWTVPLFFKLLPADTLREVGQATLSAVCWVGLAAVLALNVETRLLKRIAFATVCAVGLVAPVTNWDTVILGESVAISLTIGLIAAWWLHVMRPTKLTTALVCVVSVLWAFLRQTNPVITVLIAILLAISLGLSLRATRAGKPVAGPGRKRRSEGRQRMPALSTAVILSVLVITLGWALPEIPKSNFNRDENLATIYSERILPSAARTAWFAHHGMPATAAVRALARTYVERGEGSGPIRDNTTFFHWMHNHGASVYAQYLLTHPGYLFAVPVTQAIGCCVTSGQASSLVSQQPSVLSGAIYGEIRPVLPAPIEDLLFGGAGTLMLMIVAAGTLAAFAYGLHGWTRRELVPMLGVLTSLALFWVTFFGAASELQRHNILPAVAIRVSLLIVAVLAADRLCSRRASDLRRQ